jgi:hypothetical protein
LGQLTISNLEGEKMGKNKKNADKVIKNIQKTYRDGIKDIQKGTRNLEKDMDKRIKKIQKKMKKA